MNKRENQSSFTKFATQHNWFHGEIISHFYFSTHLDTSFTHRNVDTIPILWVPFRPFLQVPLHVLAILFGFFLRDFVSALFLFSFCFIFIFPPGRFWSLQGFCSCMLLFPVSSLHFITFFLFDAYSLFSPEFSVFSLLFVKFHDTFNNWSFFAMAIPTSEFVWYCVFIRSIYIYNTEIWKFWIRFSTTRYLTVSNGLHWRY